MAVRNDLQAFGSFFSAALREMSRLRLALLMVVFLGLQALTSVLNVPLGSPPDELAHLSYVGDAIRSPVLMPDYTNGTIIGDAKTSNYLAHPPLYYSVMGVAGKALHLSPYRDYQTFRIFSLLMVVAGLVFVVLTASELRLNPETSALALFACAGIPMFGYLAGSVSNDNLLYLGVSMVLYGVAKTRNQIVQSAGMAPWIAVAGLIIVCLTKATATAFMVFFFGWWGLLQIRQLRPFELVRQWWPKALAILAVVGGYYLVTRWNTGRLFPVPRLLYLPTEVLNPIGFLPYLDAYVSTMLERLPLVFSHLGIDPFPPALKPAFFAFVALPIVGWLITRFSATLVDVKSPHIHWLDAMFLAALTTVVLHIAFGYKYYLVNGHLGGFQPRYYAYLLPALWLPFFALCRAGWLRNLFVVAFAMLALGAFWGSSPFFWSKQDETIAAKRQTKVYQTAPAGEIRTMDIVVDEPAKGLLDSFALNNGALQVRGWAFDLGRGLPIARVWVVSHNKFIASSKIHIPRPDVAQAFGNPAANLSGFHFVVTRIPATATACDFQVMAEYSNGTLASIPNPACPASTP